MQQGSMELLWRTSHIFDTLPRVNGGKLADVPHSTVRERFAQISRMRVRTEATAGVNAAFFAEYRGSADDSGDSGRPLMEIIFHGTIQQTTQWMIGETGSDETGGKHANGAATGSHSQVLDSATREFINAGSNGKFLADDHEISYTLGSSWYNSNRYSKGQNLPRPTLDVVLAHEFGHTHVGRSALGLPSTKGRMRVNPETGGYIYSLQDLDLEEIRAIKMFENPYRAERGLELRKRYDDLPIY